MAVAGGAGEGGGEGFDWAAGEGASGGEAEGEGADAVGVAVVVAPCADFREREGGAEVENEDWPAGDGDVVGGEAAWSGGDP